MKISRGMLMSIACLLAGSLCANAQFGREAVWMTAGSNAQRSSWIKADALIARDHLSDFQFLWKVQLEKPGVSVPTEPIVMERYIGYRGFRSLAFVGSVTDDIYAVDTDLNRIEWQQRLKTNGAVPSSCSAVMSASVTLPAGVEFPTLAAGGGYGRGGPAKSGVGEALEGAVTLASVAASVPPKALPTAPPGPPKSVPSRPVRVPNPIVLFTLTSDGMFHRLYVSNGEESEPPVRLLPAGSVAHGLIVTNQFATKPLAYVVAGEGCGSAADELLAMDLTTKEVSKWSAEGAAISGSEGGAIGPDGTVYVATSKGGSRYGSAVVALESRTLKLKDWYSAPGEDFTSTPAIFQYKNKVLVAAATKDGGIRLLNSASLGGADHHAALAKTPGTAGANFVPGSLTAWEDSTLTYRLLAAGANGLQTWKVVDDEHGVTVLEPGWSSPNVPGASAPLVINGVAFTASNSGVEKGRSARASVLYALDAATGKELWNSKASITSSAAALSAGAGHVYVTTNEGALYAFGFPMEH